MRIAVASRRFRSASKRGFRSAAGGGFRSAARLQRGYTLIELLVSVVLAGLITGAAFHIHFTFTSTLNRQDNITRIQQTMKVTRRLVARYLRAAGAGMMGNTWTGCGGIRQVGPFVFHNSNPIGSTDTSEGSNNDPDPDWFEITSADLNSSSYLSGQSPVMSSEFGVLNPEQFKVGDIFGIPTESGMCIFMVSKTQIQPAKIQARPGDPVLDCYNSPAMRSKCRDVLGQQFFEANTAVVNFSNGTAAFRIDDTNPRRPMLMMAAGNAGGDPNQYVWQPIAEGVEDMQVALHVDNSDPADALGDYWVNSRDLRATELDKVRAVRISLVFRSTSEVPGWNAGLRPALEDRPAATANDGYIRRVLTTVFKLRNTPRETAP